MKIRPNEPCPCNSGRKYKKCCGNPQRAQADWATFSAQLAARKQQFEAKERIRQAQQGLGRPIVSTTLGDHQLVAVRNQMFFSKEWRAFPDFLISYLRKIMGSEWGNDESAKPLDQRHPILRWFEGFRKYQNSLTKPASGKLISGPINGLTTCFLGLAHNLYLIAHNVELQDRLVKRLRHADQFQGAYYELIVAGALIRAGFTLTLEDESDGLSKHCEFSAVSKATGRKYWVEAKMKAVAGVMGIGASGSSNPKPTSSLIKQLNQALEKPAADDRLVFIDLNAPLVLGSNKLPTWKGYVEKRLRQYEEKELSKGLCAYLFVTNMPFHLHLLDPPSMAILPVGLGISDFNKPGERSMTEEYRRRQKHADAYKICDALSRCHVIPATFDGSLPSETLDSGSSSRVIIGETYDFDGVVGRVDTAIVVESDKSAYIGVTDTKGQSSIRKMPMSDAELTDYSAHPDAYFGKIQHVQKDVSDPFDFFAVMLEVYRDTPREKLIEWLAPRVPLDRLSSMAQEDLACMYCEGMTAAFMATVAKRTSEPS